MSDFYAESAEMSNKRKVRMIPMYDELIRQMMACCKGVPCEDANCGFNPKSDLDCIEQLLTRAADAIEELSHIQIAPEKIIQTMWIPVTERLPENDVPVLLSCKCGAGAYVCDGFHTKKYSVAMPFYADIDADYDEETDEYYFPEGWWEIIKNWDDYSCVAIEDIVTHWMPLPEPPESDDSLSCGIRNDSKQKSNNGACSADETSEKVQDE